MDDRTNPRREERRGTAWRRAAMLAVLTALALGAARCRQPVTVGPDLRGDRLLVAPPSRYLAMRLALVEDGQLTAARDLWAERSLLATPPTDTNGLEAYWWSQLTAAAARLERGKRDAQAFYRLATVLAEVRWYGEALAAVRKAVALDPDAEAAGDLEAVLADLDRFTSEADSVSRSLGEQAARGEVDEREVLRYVAALGGSYGFTTDALRRRGLYLGRRSPLEPGGGWRAELAVIVAHEAAAPLVRPEGTVRVRRVIVDDDRLAEPTSVPPLWRAEPGLSPIGDEIAVYHDRDAHRRAGMLLYAALERRAGVPPATLEALGQPIADAVPGWPPAPPPPTTSPARQESGHAPDAVDDPRDVGRAAEDAPGAAAGSPIFAGDWVSDLCGAQLADALRLAAAAPIFEAARTGSIDRRESRRRFIRELMSRRMQQIEMRAARVYLDQLVDRRSLGPQRDEERLLLDVLVHGPLPRWQLADIVTIACDAAAPIEQIVAARAVLRYLRRAAGIDTADDWLRLSPEELRGLARSIAAERFGGGPVGVTPGPPAGGSF